MELSFRVVGSQAGGKHRGDGAEIKAGVNFKIQRKQVNLLVAFSISVGKLNATSWLSDSSDRVAPAVRLIRTKSIIAKKII